VRQITEILKPLSPQHEPMLVDGLLRRGRKTVYPVKVSSDEMTCQDCGNTEGYTCRDYEHKVWFCATPSCIETDTKITLERDREERRVKF